MSALGANVQLTVRAIVQSDIRNILRLVDNAWRVHIRVSQFELGNQIKTMPGFLAEDKGGLRGFILIEPQRPNVALLTAAGLRDTWAVKPYLDALLPKVEQATRAENLSAVVYIGNAVWLVEELKQRGFKIREWVVAYERTGVEPPPAVPSPAKVRTAHFRDLPDLLALDTLAFDHIWRKSVGNFNEALASAASFLLAEMDDQLVGYEWCEIYRQQAHLTRLAVHPDYQGQGIGAQLLRQAIIDVLANGADRITLNTQENNYRSCALYQRFGFVDIQRRMPVLWKDLS